MRYSKEDLLSWQKIYTNAIENLAKQTKDIQTQKARLESINKLLKLWN